MDEEEAKDLIKNFSKSIVKTHKRFEEIRRDLRPKHRNGELIMY